MQYIAEDPIHVVVRNEVPALHDTSGRMIKAAQRRLYAKFARGTAPAWARGVGLAEFEFRRMPEGGVSTEQWLAFYDSVEAQAGMGWDDDEREAIEAKLAKTVGVIVVEKPRVAAPWPNYDKLVIKVGEAGAGPKQIAERIASKVEEDGYDAAEVLAYELENHARAEIIEVLQALIGEHAADAEELEELIEA